MPTHARKFEAIPAVRERVPVLVGLMGPSGSGKTYSALRLATGIQSVTGGDIVGIDTEARRMLHYADRFRFKHIQFDAPFGSLDYLACIQQQVKAGAKVIIVDSMSHEHESVGGMVDFHDRELDRLAGDDYAKRERVKMLAWQKPKAARRALINGILQLNANMIFCFRAKQTVKPVKVEGRTEFVQMGYMPIAGDEFIFEQTVCALLLPAARGVPTWQSEYIGERAMIKPAEQFADLFAQAKPLDEEIGAGLAHWAAGARGAPRATRGEQAGGDRAPPPGEREPAPANSVPPAAGAGQTDRERIAELDKKLAEAAASGTPVLLVAWNELSNADKTLMRAAKDRVHKPRAEAADRELAEREAARQEDETPPEDKLL